MQRAGVMDRDVADLAEQRHGLGIHLLRSRIGHRADEHAVLVMIEDGPLMAAGHDQQRAVLLRHVVKHDPQHAEIVVGVGVVRPVLMPLDGVAAAARLQVELQPVVADGGAHELLQDFEQPRMMQNRFVGGVLLDRPLDAPQPRVLGRMAFFEVEDVVALGDVARPLEEAVGHLLQVPHFGIRQDVRHGDVAVVLVKLHLFLG